MSDKPNAKVTEQAPIVNTKVLEHGQFDAEVLASPVPVVVDFFSNDNPPCAAFAPRYEALANKFAGRVRFFKINREAGGELATRLGVSGSPTLVFFNGGKEVGERLTGEIQRTAVKSAVDALKP